MDSVPFTTSKTSTNTNGVLGRFSKLYRKRSFGFQSIDSQKPTHDLGGIENGVEIFDWKVHPHPLEEKVDRENAVGSEETTLLSLFASISTLKLAYIQLQQAHIPYEPKNLRVADELVVMEFESLSKLEHSYIGQSSLCLEIQKHEKLLEDVQWELQSKESEIIRMRQELEKMSRKNTELEEDLERKVRPEEQFPLLSREWTPSIFANACRLALKSIHDFTKPLICLMKASGWDLNAAADCIVDSVVYRERSHKKFAFESYLSLIMLDSVHNDCFKIDHFHRVMKFSDPFDALVQEPDSGFGRFCRLKYVEAVKSKMEDSFFGNLDQREFVLSGRHPRTPFYQAFVRMARWVWGLQVMACSFIPKAEIFYVKRGAKFEEEYMESIVSLGMTDGEERVKVGLTVMPGFKIGNSVIRCGVYPCKMKSPSDNSL